MYRELKIGEITVPMLANGATPYRFNLVFKKDLITEFQGAEDNAARVTAVIPELAFIMAMAAKAKEEKIDMNLLNQEMYLEWLEQFNPMDIPMVSEEIVDIYMANNKTASEPKKKGKGKQSEN